MIRRPPRSTLDRSSAASDVYKRQVVRFKKDLKRKNEFIEVLEKYRNYKFGSFTVNKICLLYTSPSPRDSTRSRMPSSA